MGLFGIFKKDAYRPRACVSGKHEFITQVFHDAQCVPTMPQIYYICQKCSTHYYGDTPLKYGIVLEEKIVSTESDHKHFCKNCGKETAFINSSFCSLCGHKKVD